MIPRPVPDPPACRPRAAVARRTGHRIAAPLALALALLTAAAGPAPAARWAWSGTASLQYRDLREVPDEDPLDKMGATVEWSLKAHVDVSERVSVSARLCSACHGITVNHAFAGIRLAGPLTLDAGRIEVPFGDFWQRHDPASDAFLSKPLPYAMGHMLRYQADRFNLGVLPVPYVDEGATLSGDWWYRDALQVWYAVYAVNGLQSGAPRDFTFKNQLGDGGWSDNNDEPSWGGRLSLGYGAFTAGASVLRGTYDPESDFDYTVWGLDGSAWLRGVQFRGEYVARENHVLDADGARTLLRKKGFVVQAESPSVRHVSVVGRLDGLLRQGPPLGTVNDESSGLVRWTAGVNVAPSMDWAMRLQFEHWRFTDFMESDVVRVGIVTSY